MDREPNMPASNGYDQHNIQRPSSPAPSYHTLPPHTHASVSQLQALSNPLLAAAGSTPDALISILTLTSHVTPGNLVSTAGLTRHVPLNARTATRHLSARTSDGRERYRVTPSQVGATLEWEVWRDTGPGPRNCLDGTGMSIFGRLVGGSQRLSAVIGDAASGRGKQQPLITLEYESIRKTGRLDLPMFTVGAKDVGMRWEIVTLAHAENNDTSRRRSTSRLSSDTHDRKREHAGLSSLRLVDDTGNMYAEYTPKVALPDLSKDGEVWGDVALRARAVLIDGDDGLGEKMDRAFLTLVMLLETFVWVLGGSKREHRNWGNLAAGTGCVVM